MNTSSAQIDVIENDQDKREYGFLLFRKSTTITMGSRMNPDRKIYIGGLPNDANK